MRIVIQRVSRASVRVGGELVGSIGRGLLLFVAIETHDTEKILDTFANKVVHLRIFSDEAGKMNRSSLEEGTELLAVSQFTLAGNLDRGRLRADKGRTAVCSLALLRLARRRRKR